MRAVSLEVVPWVPMIPVEMVPLEAGGDNVRLGGLSRRKASMSALAFSLHAFAYRRQLVVSLGKGADSLQRWSLGVVYLRDLECS